VAKPSGFSLEAFYELSLVRRAVSPLYNIYKEDVMKENNLVITPGQMSEFWRQVNIRQIGRDYFQDFLDHRLFRSNPFLRRISDKPLNIKATEGKRIIAEAKDIFPGGTDSDFRRYGADEAGSAKSETPVVVYEVIRDGKHRQFFGSIGDIEELCFTQDQIICFVETHREWLLTDGMGTFFLFRSKKTKFKKDLWGEFFVASVLVNHNGVSAFVDRFGNSYDWGAAGRHRLVVPQHAS